MPLRPRERIGVYEVTAAIGAGGMGEVFRARDTRLNRDVALKALAPGFALDADRLARFQREAQVLASLNHPNITQIYGLEQNEDTTVIVMELVDGVVLSDRVARGPIPLGEALSIARQIADALDAAHERGIVHRDLKPANIAIASDGTVKVLDLGLAKAEQASESIDPRNLTHSPTMVRATVHGVLLGTAPYMSPEQARGKPVDKRADIWAFGCVLYEMLTGRRAFDGDTTTDVLAKIVEREPAWEALPAQTPPSLVRLLKRTLEKDVKGRLRDIGDARAELDAPAAVTERTPAARRAPAALAAALIGGIGLGGIATWLATRAPASRPPRATTLTFLPPDGATLELLPPVPSPDGTRVAFFARGRDGQRGIWIRTLASMTPRRLVTAEGVGNALFWSPDGAWLAFPSGGKLKRINVDGGPILNICTINSLLGGTWNGDNVIVFAPSNRTTLHRVSAAGGIPEPLTALNAERRENSHRWPSFLPDGRHFLFTARSDSIENNFIYVGSLDSKEVKPLIAAQSPGLFVAPDMLLYVRERALMAQRIDVRALSLVGESWIVAADVAHSTASSQAFLGASSDGAILSFLPATETRSALTWFSRAGESLGTVGPERSYIDVEISPDGRVAAVVTTDQDSGNRDIWLVTLANGMSTRFTSNPANDWQMTWAPDGKRLAFASDRNGRSSVYVKPIDGGNEELLLRFPDRGVFPKSWSRDGRVLTLGVDTTAGVPKLWAMSFDTRKPFPIGSDEGPKRENEAQLAASAKWVAFESNQTDVTDVYLAPFPSGARRQLSSGGGISPRWGPGDRELYYLAPDGRIMVVAFTGPEMEAAPPRPLLRLCPLSVPPSSAGSHLFDVTSDGGRFLAICSAPGSDPTHIVVAIDALAGGKH